MARTTVAECERIVAATRDVIADAIRQDGSTIPDFLDGIGRRGGYQGYHLVYDRKGQPCVKCGASIRAVVVGQRSSFYCLSCQRRRAPFPCVSGTRAVAGLAPAQTRG